MKTTTVEVGGLVSSPGAAGVQRRRAAHAGVRQMDVERVAASASIDDESVPCKDVLTVDGDPGRCSPRGFDQATPIPKTIDAMRDRWRSRSWARKESRVA